MRKRARAELPARCKFAMDETVIVLSSDSDVSEQLVSDDTSDEDSFLPRKKVKIEENSVSTSVLLSDSTSDEGLFCDVSPRARKKKKIEATLETDDTR